VYQLIWTLFEPHLFVYAVLVYKLKNILKYKSTNKQLSKSIYSAYLQTDECNNTGTLISITKRICFKKTVLFSLLNLPSRIVGTVIWLGMHIYIIHDGTKNCTFDSANTQKYGKKKPFYNFGYITFK